MQLRLILRCLVWECAGDDYGHRAVRMSHCDIDLRVQNVPGKHMYHLRDTFIHQPTVLVPGVADVHLQVLCWRLLETSSHDTLPPLR